MNKQFLALIVLALAITLMACSEPYDPNIKVVVNKQVFTMNIDDKDWVADSTLLMVSTARVGYNVAIGIKFSDKVKKIPAETIYLYVPNLQAGESVQLPSKTYRLADLQFGYYQGSVGSVAYDTRSTAEYKITKTDTKGLSMTFSANFYVGLNKKIIKNGNISLIKYWGLIE